jgi:hypothetical protein
MIQLKKILESTNKCQWCGTIKSNPLGICTKCHRFPTALGSTIQKEFVEGFDMEVFRNMTKFSQRSRYAKEKLQRLTSGTGREIFKIDDKKVLKLAKNEKGIAQNTVESDYLLNDMYGDIIAKVLESDNDRRWIVSEYAKKISPSRFKSLVGVTIYEFWAYLYDRKKSTTANFWYNISPEIVKKMENSEFIQQLDDMISNFDLEIGDFSRVNSFGEIDGRLVVTDYGLSSSVYNTYYNRR